MSTGPAQFAFGSLALFIVPLQSEFGWDRAGISLATTFFTITLLFALPVAGRLVDRYGSRRVLIPSMLAVSLLLATIPLGVSALWQLWLVFALIGSLGAGANALPYMRTIAAWFDRRRGLAIGITLAGAGLGYTYVPPMLQYLIDLSGWRSGYFVLAALILVVALPLVLFFFREPASPVRGPGAQSVAGHASGVGTTRNEALKSPTFRLLFAIFSLLSFSLYGLMIHSVPMLTDRGMSTTSAALGASAIGVTIIVSRVATGYLCDRFFAPKVAAIAFALSSVGLALLAAGFAETTAFVALVLIGFSIGAEVDFMTFLTTRYFGMAHFGEIYGILFASLLLGTSLGPVCFGWSYDATGSYIVILWIATAASSVAAGLSKYLPAYSRHIRSEERQT